MSKKIMGIMLTFILVFTAYPWAVYAGDDVPDGDLYEEEIVDAADTEDEEYTSVTEGELVSYDDDNDTDTEPGEDTEDEYPIIMSKKTDLNLYFSSVPGEKKYTSVNKKLASVNKKGILTVKKAGLIDIHCHRKEGTAWVYEGTITLDLRIPKASMKTIPAGALYKEGQSINLLEYITDNEGIEPSHWSAKADPEVAVFDDQTGELTCGRKKGSVVVYAEYCCLHTDGYGKDPLARTLKFTVKIDHRKMDLSKELPSPPGIETRYTVSDKKTATISKKGILSFKKEGSVTVNIQIKDGKRWIYPGTNAVSYTLRKNSGDYDIQEGAAERAIDEYGNYTTKEDVSYYIYQYGRLPQNFITKKEAQALGWPGGGLDPYANGKCIGGDYYGNYEGLLPEGGDYRECDINTMHKKDRGAKRLVYDLSDGDIYYTSDHYKTFIQLY